MLQTYQKIFFAILTKTNSKKQISKRKFHTETRRNAPLLIIIIFCKIAIKTEASSWTPGGVEETEGKREKRTTNQNAP